jgi:hypothetical protein
MNTKDFLRLVRFRADFSATRRAAGLSHAARDRKIENWCA